jgi:transcriptional regulator with XRE-family HTH domain
MYLLLPAAGGKDKDMYFNQVEFGQRIRELRRTGGLTQEALSEELNISTDYLLMGRDYVNLHSRKRLEGVLQELSGIIADLQDV